MAWKFGEPLNARPFQHYANGLEVFSDRCDLRNKVYIVTNDGNAPEPMVLAEGIAVVMGYHAANILPQLNGFLGYDTLSFHFISQGDAEPLKAQLDLL